MGTSVIINNNTIVLKNVFVKIFKKTIIIVNKSRTGVIDADTNQIEVNRLAFFHLLNWKVSLCYYECLFTSM